MQERFAKFDVLALTHFRHCVQNGYLSSDAIRSERWAVKSLHRRERQHNREAVFNLYKQSLVSIERAVKAEKSRSTYGRERCCRFNESNSWHPRDTRLRYCNYTTDRFPSQRVNRLPASYLPSICSDPPQTCLYRPWCTRCWCLRSTPSPWPNHRRGSSARSSKSRGDCSLIPPIRSCQDTLLQR